MRPFFKFFIIVVCIPIVASAIWLDYPSDSGRIGVGTGLYGMFSIGLPPSPPVFPDVRNILSSNYRTSSPDGAFISFLINGKIYSTGELAELMFPDSAAWLEPHLSSATIIDTSRYALKTEWFIRFDRFGNDSVYIRQLLSPQTTPDSAFVSMEWLVQNRGGATKDIGVILFLDFSLMSESTTVFAVFPTLTIPVPTMTIFPDSALGLALPNSFNFNQFPPPAPGLVAIWDLVAPPFTPPDRACIGEIRDLLGTFWEPSLTFTEIMDLATLAWWNPITLARGDSIVIRTSIIVPDDTSSLAERATLPEDLDINLFPNPFNASLNISLAGAAASESSPGQLAMKIFDINGKLVCELPQPRRGAAPASWTPGTSVASGVFIVKVSVCGKHIVKKAVLLR